jgi:hypothetical protein
MNRPERRFGGRLGSHDRQYCKMTTVLMGFPPHLGELQRQEGVALIRERLRPHLGSHA